MSGIVLSASVRQNLLSLQSTAALLATTQNDLATGNKVNSALDNPTEFFTAQGLNNRASDISNLLDSIGNGVQVLQAANTGITSLQSLIADAQSIANQVLQTPVGYSTKSNVTSAALTGATANDLLGTVGVATNAAASATSALTTITSTANTAATNAKVTGTTNLTAGLTDTGSNQTFTINGHTVTLTTGTGTGTGTSPTQAFTLANIEAAINGTAGVGVTATDDGAGHLILTSTGTAGASDAIVTTGTSSLFGIANATVNGANAVPGTALTFDVDSQAVTLAAGSSYTGAQVASAINSQVGSIAGVNASYSTGKLVVTSTGTPGASDAVTVGTFSTGNATQLGFATASVTANGTSASGGLSGETLTIGATGGGTATNITFGTTSGDISTLNQLNAVLAANNLQATISTTGLLSIVTSDDAASSTIGAIGGTATGVGSAFAGAAAEAPVEDPDSQATRSNLVAQYNNVLQQINTTAQDSSFNGINLLNGDTLNLTFDETGASKLAITGVTFNDAGLGLSTLTSGTDFLDSNSANNVLTQLTAADTTLRGEASALGSNLSIVEIRQDFNKNLVNVLQTGASNLTLADSNEEAANSQALSTRQSIAVSALALANQSQQSVLQLLR
jgi:flagellin-like hook-associated protein FlgL